MLLPFAMSSLIAHGVMPVRAADGAVMLVICSGNGMIEKTFDTVAPEPVDEADHSPDPNPPGSCRAWAANQISIMIPPLVILAEALLSVTDADLSWTHVVLKYSRVTGLPPATGPPFRGLKQSFFHRSDRMIP